METKLKAIPTSNTSAKKPSTKAKKDAKSVFVSDSTESVVAKLSELKFSDIQAMPIGLRKFSSKYIKTKNKIDKIYSEK